MTGGIYMSQFNNLRAGKADTATISNIIQCIKERNLLLPALQRKFIWTDEQIIKLFDSMMRGYPIGTLIFWKLKSQIAREENYTFYEFINNYSENYRDSGYINEHLPKPMLSCTHQDLLIVLDGQQRLTSIYTSLQGSITRKKPYKKEYITRELYFNLKTRLYTEDNNSEENSGDNECSENKITSAFAFLSHEEYQKQINLHQSDDSAPLWFKVKEILNYPQVPDIANYLHHIGLECDKLVYQNMVMLMNKINNEDIFNIYVYQTDDMNKVQEVFVRVNSGGTKLCKTDLFFSAIVSQWEEAREEFDSLHKEIKFNYHVDINTDFIMRTCLYLIPNMSTKLSLRSFTPDKIKVFKKNWQKMRKSILHVLDLLKSMGLNAEQLPSMNSIIPIIYYHYQLQTKKITSPSITNIRIYLIASNIESLFGRSQDTVLDRIRKSIDDNLKKSSVFPKLKNMIHNGEPMIHLDRQIIESWLDYPKEDIRTLFVLNLLYPNYNYKAISVNIDHMHPMNAIKKLKESDLIQFPGLESILNADSLDSKTRKHILKQRKEELKSIANSLSNLQILTEEENKQKSDTPLKEWLHNHSNIPYLPSTDYELENIVEFTTQRKRLIQHKLCEILNL